MRRCTALTRLCTAQMIGVFTHPVKATGHRPAVRAAGGPPSRLLRRARFEHKGGRYGGHPSPWLADTFLHPRSQCSRPGAPEAAYPDRRRHRPRRPALTPSPSSPPCKSGWPCPSVQNPTGRGACHRQRPTMVRVTPSHRRCKETGPSTDSRTFSRPSASVSAGHPRASIQRAAGFECFAKNA